MPRSTARICCSPSAAGPTPTTLGLDKAGVAADAARLHRGRRSAPHQRPGHLGAGRLQRPGRLHAHRLQRLRDRRRQPARQRRAPGQRPHRGLRPLHRSAARPRRPDRGRGAQVGPAGARWLRMAMEDVNRAFEKGETQGFMKVLVDAETKQILGRLDPRRQRRRGHPLAPRRHVRQGALHRRAAGGAHPPDRVGADPDHAR